jgi:hypothetical protein
MMRDPLPRRCFALAVASPLLLGGGAVLTDAFEAAWRGPVLSVAVAAAMLALTGSVVLGAKLALDGRRPLPGWVAAGLAIDLVCAVTAAAAAARHYLQ